MKQNREYWHMDAVNGLCTGCGICVSESEGSLRMAWDEYGFQVPEQISGKKVPEGVLKVCPFNSAPEESVKDEDKLANLFFPETLQNDPSIGNFMHTYAGYSHDYRETSSSGGVATYIFEQLLRRQVVDHLYIVKEVRGNYEYQVFSSAEEIIRISKTRYIPVTLEKLFTEVINIKGKIAVSGVGCFIKAIRLKQFYHPELKAKIPFLIGIICGGWKSRFFTDFLSQKAGIRGDYYSQEYRIKDRDSTASDYSFGAFDDQDKFYDMKMSVVGDMWGTGFFKANACDFCTDVTSELADISLGDAWLPEFRKDGMGNSVIITRSSLADLLIREGIEQGSLKVTGVSREDIYRSQKSSFSHRRDALKFRQRWYKWRGIELPYVRKRIFRSISILYALVQIQRSKVRKYSLEYWKETGEVGKFESKMKWKLLILKILTKLYHKFRS